MDPADAASDLLRQIWRNRHALWPAGVPDDPVDIIDLEKVAHLFGYRIEVVPEIPNWPPNRKLALAGIVDPARKLITLSEQFGGQSMRFTAAHEIGHVRFDRGRQFRERPIEGPREQLQDPIERRADRFAASLLMPGRLLLDRVAEIAGDVPVTMNDETAFWLAGDQYQELLWDLSDRTGEFALARCRRNLQRRQVVPLHEQFKVSVKAMAYRLQELGAIVRH